MNRRLYFRLYLTLLAVTLICLLAVAVTFHAVGGAARAPAERLRQASAVLVQTVPELDFPADCNRLVTLADELGTDLAVWDGRGATMCEAVVRPMLPPRRLIPGWAHGRPGLELVLAVGPDRFLGVRNRLPLRRPNPFFFALAALAVLMAVGSYPVARRITRRLETLEGGVKRWGGGDLAHRVAVEGDDEVATLAASFNRAAGEVEALVAQQRQMVANASHELRSPLARLRMGLELVSEEPDPDRRARLIEGLKGDLADLDCIVEEVLLIARAEARPPHRPFAPVDLRALLETEAARTGAEVVAGPASLMGDATMLRHLIRNLLENAQRHGGGEVVARLERAGDTLIVAVEDRGPGVPEGEREEIFAPFYRLPGGKPQEAGVGLGLALVRQVAHFHGGQARVLPRPGGGSRFEVLLPAGAAPASDNVIRAAARA